MAEPYAEVIGDPVAQSLSPAIHRHWLRALGMVGDFRATRCTDLRTYLATRRADPDWRGCSVTMPLKEQAAVLVDSLDADAAASGAVNCIVPADGRLAGHNTDTSGIAAALSDTSLSGRIAIVIGAGGAARAVVTELARRSVNLMIVARSLERAARLRTLAPNLAFADLDTAPAALVGAALIVNASPLGMAGAPPMPEKILAALPSATAALDMVYRPLETPFLRAAAAAGLRTADGLTILIGQARRAFTYFFGAAPPENDAELRALLIGQLRAG